MPRDVRGNPIAAHAGIGELATHMHSSRTIWSAIFSGRARGLGSLASIAIIGVVTACSGGGRATGPHQPETPTPPAEPATEARALWVSRFEFDSPAKVELIMQRAPRVDEIDV